jgi:hypothetical protein
MIHQPRTRCGHTGSGSVVGQTPVGGPTMCAVQLAADHPGLPCRLLPCLPGGVEKVFEQVVAVGAVGAPLACFGVVQVITEDTVVFVQLWVPALC